MLQSGNSAINAVVNTLIGYDAGATGLYTLQSGTLATSGIWSGHYGTGTFNQSGGLAAVSGNLRIGEYTGSSGTVGISGGTLNVSDSLNVGEGGIGAMSIANKSQVTAGQVNVGGPSYDGQPGAPANSMCRADNSRCWGGGGITIGTSSGTAAVSGGTAP